VEVTVTTLQRLVDGTWKGSFEFKSKDLAEVDTYVDKKVHLFRDAPVGNGQTMERVSYLLQTVVNLLDTGSHKVQPDGVVVHSSWDENEQPIPKAEKDIAAHIPVGVEGE
jgi:hypothetical protein